MAMSTDDECWSRSSNVAIAPREESGAEVLFGDRGQEERSGDERRGDKFWMNLTINPTFCNLA
jgi:hypothetical protein